MVKRKALLFIVLALLVVLALFAARLVNAANARQQAYKGARLVLKGEKEKTCVI
jgi:hypothetical protein